MKLQKGFEIDGGVAAEALRLTCRKGVAIPLIEGRSPKILMVLTGFDLIK